MDDKRFRILNHNGRMYVDLEDLLDMLRGSGDTSNKAVQSGLYGVADGIAILCQRPDLTTGYPTN